MKSAALVAIAFTLGALAAALKYERAASGLRAEAECNYHTGYDEGFNQGQVDEREAQARYSVVYKDVTDE